MSVDRVGGDRILIHAPATLSVTFEQDGAATDPGDVTVGVVDARGTVIVPAGTATTNGTKGVRSYALAAQTALNWLIVSWVSATLGTVTTDVEVVGAHLFSLAEARAFDGGTLANPNTYPTAALEAVRARITDAFEDICGVSFIPRYKLVMLDGSGLSWLTLPDLYVSEIRSVETRSGQTWTPYGSSDLADVLADDIGRATRESAGIFSAGRRNVRIGYVYGYPRPPLEIKRAALRLTASFMGVTRTDWDPRATSMSTDVGIISLATPGRRGSWFGFPEVDAILDRYNQRVPMVG